MGIALVTGASSGLGREFVRQLGVDPAVQEIWAVARRQDRLEQLKQISVRPVRPIPLDLTQKGSIQALKALLEEERPNLSVLVCAAGAGKMGDTMSLSPEENDAMIDLNCRAAVAVTTVCFPYLRRGSRVLELCSTAAFQPMPGLNVYAATKAFLMSYTKTLHYECLPKGIHVTAVCPYWVKDTEFIPLAQDEKPGQFRHFPLASKSASVVRLSLAASRLNLWAATPGVVCTLHRFGAKFIPHFVMVPLTGLLRRL